MKSSFTYTGKVKSKNSKRDKKNTILSSCDIIYRKPVIGLLTESW